MESLNITLEEINSRLGRLLRGKFIFKENNKPFEDEPLEDFTLDPHALDRQVAADKAVKEGKDIKAAIKSATKPNLATGPVYTPSKSDKLSTDDYNHLMMKIFPAYESLNRGDMSEDGVRFVAWDLVRRYPANYIGKTNRPKCVPFFEAMTEEQTWDFFYVYHPQDLAQQPFIFIPTEQFEHFLDIINASVQTKLTIPPGQPADKFNLTFGSSCTIRPKYIGRSSSDNEYKALQAVIPSPEHEDACQDATVHSMEFLLHNLNAHLEKAPKSKNKKKKQEKAASRDESIYDAQLYLGLRPVANAAVDKTRKVVLDEPVPYDLHKDVVFLCIDIEVAEEHHGTILEVGMAALDTRELVGIAPAEIGRNWFHQIKSRHLISEEHKFMRNRKYIQGCPELFDFGESEYTKIAELPARIKEAFEELSKRGIPEGDESFRNIVLVGHDLNSDLSYLASMKVNPWDVRGMMRCLDTKDMHQVFRQATQGRNLGFVCQDLDIRCKNLHNAGNDAAYTLRAMLGLAVRTRVDEEQKQNK
ncbi:Good for full DBP5 activity protein 2 [Colletotrichum trifolii]|uniref:Good for full DBP5 activity protein 2 n=1 Tax=Colletotrichum trifolii TaxID=5466 RepID=A0A4R8RR22_COLTR|nr:Good for full DBP5 activity protein 2 [Colletotrichum trifolii]